MELRKTMKMAGTRAILALAVMGVLGVAGGCNTTDPGPFDPIRLQEAERARAREVQSRPKRPLPTTLESPFLTNGPTTRGAASTKPVVESTTRPLEPGETALRLPLQEIVQRAVTNNLDVRVAGYEPAIEETRVVENRARFDPSFFSNIQYRDDNSRTAGSVIQNPLNPLHQISIDETESETWSAAAGLRQLGIYGTEAELRYEASRTKTDPRQFELNPYYENNLVLEITQPLLRNFGREVNEARIVVARNNQRISMLDLRRQIEETSQDIEQAYWELVRAQRDVQILEDLLQDTIDTAEILFRRRGQDVTRVQISQANSSVENRRALLIRARARIRDLSDQLKRMMNDPDMPVTSATLILPGVEPLEQPVHFDLDDTIDTALENRAELAQQQIRIDSATIASRVAKNNLMPELNFVGSAAVQGLDDTFGSAADDQTSFDNFGYAVGFEFEIPIGNRAARAAYQRSLLQRQQAIDQYRNLIEQVSLEVKTSMREVQTTWEEMAATRQARFAAADALRAIEQREAANEPLTPTFVQLKLDAQATLANVQQAENQAVSDYNFAIARLERAKGTILRYNNVVMAEDKPGTRRW
jgi:outer membrane protein TolC